MRIRRASERGRGVSLSQGNPDFRPDVSRATGTEADVLELSEGYRLLTRWRLPSTCRQEPLWLPCCRFQGVSARRTFLTCGLMTFSSGFLFGPWVGRKGLPTGITAMNSPCGSSRRSESGP